MPRIWKAEDGRLYIKINRSGTVNTWQVDDAKQVKRALEQNEGVDFDALPANFSSGTFSKIKTNGWISTEGYRPPVAPGPPRRAVRPIVTQPPAQRVQIVAASVSGVRTVSTSNHVSSQGIATQTELTEQIKRKAFQEFKARFPLRFSGLTNSRCCSEPTILVKSNNRRVARSCFKCGTEYPLSRSAFLRTMQITGICPDCRDLMLPNYTPTAQYTYKCRSCSRVIKLADLLPTWRQARSAGG